MDDKRAEAHALEQHGLITRSQAEALGLTPSAIRHRVRSGRWIAVTRGLFRLLGAPKSPEQLVMAAILVSGDSAVASHETAAALHGLPGFGIEPVTVTVPRHGRRSLPGTRIEESLALMPSHVVQIDRIPCTSLARTLFDLSANKGWRRTARAMDTALASKRVTNAALWRVLIDLAEHGRDGTVVFRTLLQERAGDYVAPESELERRFIVLARNHGLPDPERQVDLGDDEWIGRVDFLFRGARVVVEVDGAAFHDGLLDRQRDEHRDARLRGLGWTVLRFRWDDIVDRPTHVAHAIRFQREIAS